MLDNIKKWLGYYNGWATAYTGTGHLQGIGFDLEIKIFEIKRFNIRIITDLKITEESQWLERLKDKLCEAKK